jgi:hypothetical protein
MDLRTNLKFNLNQAIKMVLHLLSAAPASPTEGQVYHNTTTHHPEYHNGTAFKDLTDAEKLGGQDSAYHRARANHTGTQTASTISDFDNQVRSSRLDQMAAPNTDLSIAGHKLTNVGTPTAGSDAATKSYADALSAGRDWKDSARVATTANITLSGTQTIDGVAVIAGDRVLVKNQTTGSENGIWVVAAGAWARAADADADVEVTGGLTIPIEEGTVNADTRWLLTTNNPITVGTTALTFTEDAGETTVAGAGLTKSANTFNVGAGTGVVVNADSVQVDTAVVPLMYSATVGDNSATSFTIAAATHGTGGNRKKIVQVVDAGTNDYVDADRSVASNGDVTIAFAVAPTSNQYRVNILGTV